ncbi:MAG TPA: tetratricopeptide repeat protein, partial [Geobacteraceae bacterium]|nr:tetratricopeptide repeat protein [Geobacteraceae bacterium]
MGFFTKMFGPKDTADTTAAEPREADIVTALSLHLRGDVKPALDAYLRIAEESPDDNLAPFFTAAIMAGTNRIDEAAERLRYLSQRISSGGETISRAVAGELFSLVNEEPMLSVPPVAEIIVSCGDRLKEEGFAQESAVCFEIAAGLLPDHANVLHKLGDTLHDLGIYDYAEAVLRKALEYAPNHWDSLYTYAVLLQDLGRFDEAIGCYEKAVVLNPDHVKCHNNYGAALMLTNRLDEALAHCTVAAELDPAFPL